MKFRDMLPWHQGNTAVANPNTERPFDNLFDEMRDMMRRFDQDWWLDEPNKDLFVPSLDIAEDDNAYTLHAELPGIEPAHVKLEINNGYLTIHGEKVHEEASDDKTWHRRETMRGTFRRVLQLPPDADMNDIKAAFKQGVLTVTVPKTEQTPKGGRRIPIDA